jgi:hypothetical protein
MAAGRADAAMRLTISASRLSGQGRTVKFRAVPPG